MKSLQSCPTIRLRLSSQQIEHMVHRATLKGFILILRVDSRAARNFIRSLVIRQQSICLPRPVHDTARNLLRSTLHQSQLASTSWLSLILAAPRISMCSLTFFRMRAKTKVSAVDSLTALQILYQYLGTLLYSKQSKWQTI